MARRARAYPPLLLLAMAVVTGCTTQPTVPSPTPAGVSFHDSLISLRAEAEDSDASAEQLSELDSAIANGEISFETASTAVQRAVECMRDAGLVADTKVDTRGSGFEVPMYVATLPVNLDQEAGMALVDDCDRREHYFVSLAFQTQPEAKAADDALIAERAPTLIECLEEHERDVPPQPSNDELVRAALDYMTAQFEAGVSSEFVINCLDLAGIDAG